MKNASTASGNSLPDAASNGEPTLQRGLQNRHIQLIALGGAIGTGLFLGIGPAIQMAGPAVLLGYGVAGIIAFLIMRQLGEMVVEEPVSGSFAHFAYKYWGPFAGFLSGWNYWVMFVLVGMAELTAAGIYMQYWLPDVPTWIWAAAFFIIINAVNLVNVRLYGETEFWFALIKVLAIIGMIGFGLWMLFSGNGGEHASIENLWRYNGFFAGGIDEDFNRDLAVTMPFTGKRFFALTTNSCVLATVGGLTIDGNCQVLDTDDKVIGGLYAVGNASGNFFAGNYPRHIPGTSIGRAITSGYYTGRLVASL